MWVGVLLILIHTSVLISHAQDNIKRFRLNKLCKFCDIESTACNATGFCQSFCDVTSICEYPDEVCVSAWRRINGSTTLETVCHNPSLPFHGEHLMDYNNSICLMQQVKGMEDDFYICSCNTEECNDHLFFTQVKNHTCEAPAIGDIVILVDGSSSIGHLNFEIVRSFLGMFVRAFAVGSEQTRIGLVLSSKDSRIEWHLNTHSTEGAMIDAVRNLTYKGGNTLTGLALTYILENSFKAESGSRPDVPKIGILITDGKSQDDVVSPAQRLRDAGIELFAIGVKAADENELRAIASPPEDTHVYYAADFSFMLDILEKLTRSVCERISELSREISGEENLLTSEVTAGRLCVTLPENL